MRWPTRLCLITSPLPTPTLTDTGVGIGTSTTTDSCIYYRYCHWWLCRGDWVAARSLSLALRHKLRVVIDATKINGFH